MPRTRLLFDAIERYYTLLIADDSESRQEFAELQDWFESRDLCGPDSFEWLCQQHKIDAQILRRMLRRRLLATGRA